MSNQEKPHNDQPGAKPPMAIDMAKSAGTAYVKGLAKEGGKQTADYEANHGQEQLQDAQQHLDDAKAQAQGMWAKYCGCLGA